MTGQRKAQEGWVYGSLGANFFFLEEQLALSLAPLVGHPNFSM